MGRRVFGWFVSVAMFALVVGVAYERYSEVCEINQDTRHTYDLMNHFYMKNTSLPYALDSRVERIKLRKD